MTSFHSQKSFKQQSGNVLFLILIAIALFAGLGYAVTQSLSSAPGKIEDDKQKLDQAVLNNCEAAINLALLRLRNMENCDDDEINYELPDGSNANPNAPTDKHCNIFHPQYGGASPCGLLIDPSCDLTTLSIGNSCGGIVYAGESGGNRIYTTRADHSTGVSWNSGTSVNWLEVGASSTSDGEANTDILVNAITLQSPYKAAQLCRSYGKEWYMPARDELDLLYTNRNIINGFDLSGTIYYSSMERGVSTAWGINFSNGGHEGPVKHTLRPVRCVRQD